MLREICQPQPNIKAAVIVLVQLAAVGCGSLSDDPPERAFDAGSPALGQVLPARPVYAPPTSDPILGVGHGAMALPDGTFTQPTPELGRIAQQHYKQRLFEELTSDELRAEYEAQRLQLEPAPGDEREFVDNAFLIDWLIDNAHPADASRLRSINKYLAKELSRDLPVELAIKQGSDASRAAYRDRCVAEGVPIPPRWNPDDTDPTNEWHRRGTLTPDFIGGPSTGTVWYYESNEPRGVCIALPRLYPNGKVELLGVICQGNESSKACFWDNAEPMDPTAPAEIMSDAFNGGDDLEGGCGGICTQCHRGENVFIVHPDSPLDLGRNIMLADDWVEPLVPAKWHQNPRPTAPSPLESVARDSNEGSCLDCHTQQGSGGRLGLLAEGYCNIVLTAITERSPNPLDPTAQPTKTMPPQNADYHKLTPSDEMALREICAGATQVEEPRNDPPPPEEPTPEL